METKVSNSVEIENKHEQWFSTFIDQVNESIKEDKRNLETGNASSETIELYRSLQNEDTVSFMSITRSTSSLALVREIVLDFLRNLKKSNVSPLKLALDMSQNKVLAWLEIPDNDEITELKLIDIEAKVNAKFEEKCGISFDSIIVEKCDNLDIPSHYQIVSIG